MNKLIPTILLLFLTTGIIAQSISQQLSSTAGGGFSNTSYQVGWSIGECVTATSSNDDFILTSGFYQTDYIITTVEKQSGTELNVFVYPNPTTRFVELKIEHNEEDNIKYVLTDLNGKILKNGAVQNNIEQINLTDYASGIYFLTVKQDNKQIKSFKLIKK